MVQLRDIFPALLLVGCAGKTAVESSLRWKGSAFVGLLVARVRPLVTVDRRRSSSLPGRSAGFLLSGRGGSPAATDVN